MTDQSAQGYDGIAKLFHWLIAILIFVIFGLGWYMTDLDPLAPRTFELYQIHKGIGITIFALAVLRLLWRLTHKAPPYPASMAGWERLAATGAHWALYGLIFLQPLIGILQSNAANFPIVLWGAYELPALIGPNKAVGETLLGAHHLVAKVMAALILAHIAAALRHHIILKDDVLRGMLPAGAIATAVVILALGIVGPLFISPSGTPEAPSASTTNAGGVENVTTVDNTTVENTQVENTTVENTTVENTTGVENVTQVENVANEGDGTAEENTTSAGAGGESASTAETASETASSDPGVSATVEELVGSPGAWTVEEGSVLGFVARQQGSPVEGTFENFEAAILFEPDDLDASRLIVDIDATSITTGHSDRDKTLNSPSFFDTEQWPKAAFESKAIKAAGEGQYEASAALTIRDATHEVALPFTLEITDDPDDPAREIATASGALPINRLDYGVGQGDWTSTVTVADEVIITIDIKASRQK